MNSATFRLRLLFVVISLFFAVLLSLRPIPSIYDFNDTGRYIVMYHNTCEAPLSFDWDGKLSHESFNLLSSASCWAKDNQFYLFLTALITPLSLLSGISKFRGQLILGLGLILSVNGFELMTNALRQGASIFFLISAFNLQRYKLWQLLFAIIAIFLHDSSWVFLPLLIGFNYEKYHKWHINFKFIITILVSTTLMVYLIDLKNAGKFDDIDDSLNFYKQIYENNSTLVFLCFMSVPLYWIYIVRLTTNLTSISIHEKVTIIYSTFIVFICFIYFPAITYRFLMTAFVLQLYMTMSSTNLSIKVSKWILFGLILHLIIYCIYSPNFLNLLKITN